eukprot:2998122-Pyramimonas_sp.AAC.1
MPPIPKAGPPLGLWLATPLEPTGTLGGPYVHPGPPSLPPPPHPTPRTTTPASSTRQRVGR